MSNGLELDLVVLVPGKDDREAMAGLLSRWGALGIRELSTEIPVHPRRDPGCFNEGPDFLRTFQRRARHALLLFDHEGCGQARPRLEVAEDVKKRLVASGWGENAHVVVISPELETWVWSHSPQVDRALGWHGRAPRLRDWLREKGLWLPEQAKPPRPKETFYEALREASLQKSSAIFRELAETVSVQGCRDDAFQELTGTLRSWFPRLV